MKRILAVFLTLAMALNIAPAAAFAAADSDAASIVAVEETDETSSPQLDEETARAIASDPFLQAAYAQTEQEQTGQAEVDTSNMSVSATNSFGQLLVNGLGMDGENGSDLSSESRVIEITMNGSTAMVKYIAKKDANLVVGIYTDDSEQEMIASGTVAVQATPDNTASSIVEVPLSGEIPEHYTVKGFLLDKEDHAPLCKEYTNAFYTENVEELEGATIDDFDSARAVNLDDDRTTNFGVVKQGVILLQEDEPENGAGENIVVLDDSENQIYQFENASTELLNLKQGNIIVYKYGENNLIIAHVADFEINGTTVTIYGDEDFQLEDVFSILKMDGENTTDKAIVDTETGDGKVSYIGTQEIETLDSTNEWEGKAEFSHVFKISTDDGKDEDSEEKPVSGSVEGTVSIKAAIKLKLRLCDDNKMVSLSFPMTEKFELEGAVEYKGELLKFPKITLPVYGCLSVGFEPQMVFKANASVAFKMDSTQMIGFEWSQKDGTQNISEAPVTSINFKLSGSIYLGFDMAPKAELGVGKVSLVKLKFKAEAGFELSAEERLGDQGTGLDEIHGCKNCYEGELEFKITLGVSLKILLYEPKIEITPFSHSFGKAYASADYGDFGWGECPHVKYRLTLKAGKAGAGATVKIQSNDSDTSSLYTETTLDADGNSTVYLPGREYRIIADKGSMEFVKTIKLSRGITVDIDLEQGSTGGNPGTTDPDTPDPDKPDPDNPDPDPTPPSETIVASGTCGDNLTWKLDDEGTLTISGKGAMTEWVNSDSAPWKTYSNTINKVVIQPGVTSIGGHAFSKCKNLTSITIPEGVTSIGSDAFSGCSSLTSITIPEGVTSIGEYAFYACENLKSITIPKSVTSIGNYAFGGCSSLTSITIPEGVTSIEGGVFYKCSSLTSITIPESVTSIGWYAFQGCSSLTSITIPESVTSIGWYAFQGCSSLTSITIPEGVTSIGKNEFSGCKNLTSITIPEGVTIIEAEAFRGCSSLTSITIPEGVTNIGENAFRGCSSLTSITIPKGVTSIEWGTFRGCSSLKSITIPERVTSIGEYAFYACDGLIDVTYHSTMERWEKISIESNNYYLLNATIHCTDGDIVPNTENSITTGTASTSDSKFQAAFAEAKAGKEYVVLVSRSGSDPLNADNLIYINQITADADGELTVPFITAADAAEMTYVVACAQDDATVEPGQPDKPNQPDQPGGDKPGGDQPSSGDDGGGAAIILIGGVAAVAAVAGVALMMPVKVEGTVKLADQPVANATVQVLKNGNVAAQTTTDANGHFTVKVKRGGYTLRVQWTDASGQPAVRTVDFKAPNANLNVAA
ncbi:leucine-rich repeat protein [Faecalibacterium prausnitzii]|uniref:leucine-rich repeat protein n=1 Tax=Faecalibacterium prausnitzii TaxID=853 RepID=UPI001C016585|nr:leucine-rich repeat protein [Faecalibacterium prausnitzii]MBT9707736.1 leucine-rich repeat protein [Faecalibacterium prausnitzii]